MNFIENNNDYGIETSYWKLGSFSIDTTSKTAMINILLFVSEKAQKPFQQQTVIVYGETFDKYFLKENIPNYGDIYDAISNCVKENSNFESSEEIRDTEVINKKIQKLEEDNMELKEIVATLSEEKDNQILDLQTTIAALEEKRDLEMLDLKEVLAEVIEVAGISILEEKGEF